MHICSLRKVNNNVRSGMLGPGLRSRSSRLHHKVLVVLAMNKPHTGMLLLSATVRSLASTSAKRGFDCMAHPVSLQLWRLDYMFRRAHVLCRLLGPQLVLQLQHVQCFITLPSDT